jgi:hypothetical protein
MSKNESKFTPGPWELHGMTGAIVAQPPEPGRCHPVICHPTETFKRGEMRQNALLIAAAPELLAALEFILSQIDPGDSQQGRIYSDCIHPNDDDKTVLDLIKEAIAKAKGEQ